MVLDAISKLKSVQMDHKAFKKEEDIKKIIVDKIIAVLFKSSNFHLKAELNQILPSSKISAMYKLDYAFVLESHVCYSKHGQEIYDCLTDIPLIIVECSKDPLLPQFAHKDSSKIANSMAIALMDLIRCFSHQPIEFLSKLFVQGILIGGFDLEVLVMKPQFSSGSRDDDSEVKVSFLLVSSRSFSRFSFFESGVYDADLSRSDVYSSLKHGYQYLNPQSEETSEESLPVNYSDEYWTDLVSEIDYLDGDLNNFNDLNNTDLPSGWRLRRCDRISFYLNPKNWDIVPVQKSTVHEMIGHQLSRKDRNVNVKTLFVLTRIRSMADQLEDLIMHGLEDSEDPDLPDQPFDQNENVLRCYDSSRSRSDSYKSTPPDLRPKKIAKLVHTPGGGNNENLEVQNFSTKHSMKPPTRMRSYCRTFRDPAATWITVTKQDSPFELAVYLHPLIRTSLFVPRLHPTIVPERFVDHSLTLTIEKIYPLRRFGINRSDSHIVQGYARLLKDGLDALTLLHRAGFVHSDISPNNIGYNERLGNWQIFDFDQARPIADSLQSSRKGGTEHFISHQARETGIFRPIDDFIALANCITRRGMPTDFDQLFDFDRFCPLLTEISKSSEVRSDWWLRAHELSLC